MALKVAVIGAGTMGNGIAQVFAQGGHVVVLSDLDGAALERARAQIDRSLGKLAEKGKIAAEDRTATLGRIEFTPDLADVTAADLVVEAVVEKLEVKRELLAELDRITKPATILASNTSSISITTLAAATSRPDRFLGMHFFNPVPLMTLVELIRGLQTSAATIASGKAFAERLGKSPIVVKNSPGFVVNRILCPMINEAVFALAEGLATAEDIDNGMKLGCNHPIGPLALADMIGLDVLLAVMNVFYADFNDPKYRPAPLLKEMVAAGYLGRKSKHGFYRYD